MYPWKSVLELDEQNSRPKYLQIADNLIKEIIAGRLQSGQRIPGSRIMAEQLSLNRKTIILAYDELLAQGWLEVRASSGTYISGNLPLTQYDEIQDFKGESPKEVEYQDQLHFMPTYESIPSSTLVMDGGAPDVRLAPMDWIFKECRSLTKSRFGKRLLAYDGVQGDPVLRNTLTHYLAESRGMNTFVENIMITRGSQMGIFLVAQALIKTNDHVVVGTTSYDAADWALLYSGGILERVTVDDEGINTEELELLCEKKSIKLVYITPHHHFPTTVTLSNKRRIHLLQLSITYNFTILEDDYDYDFQYKSSSILPLASLNSGGRVIYIGSFSKIFAPNLRIGYLVASQKMITELGKIRRIIDRQGDHMMQRVLAEAIKSNELSRHLKKSITVYRKRRDHLGQLLSDNLKDYVDFTLPEGGMAIWAKFKNISLISLKPIISGMGLNMDIDRDLAKDLNALRMGFASINEAEQEKAIEILVKAIKRLSS